MVASPSAAAGALVGSRCFGAGAVGSSCGAARDGSTARPRTSKSRAQWYATSTVGGSASPTTSACRWSAASSFCRRSAQSAAAGSAVRTACAAFVSASARQRNSSASPSVSGGGGGQAPARLSRASDAEHRVRRGQVRAALRLEGGLGLAQPRRGGVSLRSLRRGDARDGGLERLLGPLRLDPAVPRVEGADRVRREHRGHGVRGVVQSEVVLPGGV